MKNVIWAFEAPPMLRLGLTIPIDHQHLKTNNYNYEIYNGFPKRKIHTMS